MSSRLSTASTTNYEPRLPQLSWWHGLRDPTAESTRWHRSPDADPTFLNYDQLMSQLDQIYYAIAMTFSQFVFRASPNAVVHSSFRAKNFKYCNTLECRPAEGARTVYITWCSIIFLEMRRLWSFTVGNCYWEMVCQTKQSSKVMNQVAQGRFLDHRRPWLAHYAIRSNQRFRGSVGLRILKRMTSLDDDETIPSNFVC